MARLFGSRKLKIFINYRKGDTDDPEYRKQNDTSIEARKITDALRAELGESQVFLDVDNILPGEDWRSFLKKQNHQSSVLVCLIGKHWLAPDVHGQRRLHAPIDVLREELEIALYRGLPVVPVLVNGASWPDETELPRQLRDSGFPSLHFCKLNTEDGTLPGSVKKLLKQIQMRVNSVGWTEVFATVTDLLSLIVLPLALIAILMLGLSWIGLSSTTLWGIGLIGLCLGVAALPVLLSFGTYKLIYGIRRLEPGFTHFDAYRELIKCYIQALGTRSVQVVARVRTEAAVLIPPPTEPIPTSDPDENRKQAEDFREEKIRRAKELDRLSREALGITTAKSLAAKRPELPIDTCFDLHNASESIQWYLSVVRETNRYTRRRENDPLADGFFCWINIKQGFLSPQYLTTGLMAKFDENWASVLDWYSDAVPPVSALQNSNGQNTAGQNRSSADATTESASHVNQDGTTLAPALQRVQVFEFLCWLMWGPSIPHCSCPNWHREPGRLGAIMVQFGYGDENNSFLLCDDPRTVTPVKDFFEQELKKSPGSRAFQCGARVRPIAITELAGKLCVAQEDALEQAPIVLEANRIVPLKGTAVNDHQFSDGRIYQAYVWVMFILCDSEGRPLFPDQPWRGLLPFFTHGNIADPDTYLFIRREVVRKSLDGIKDLIKLPGQVTYRFACSSDDSNCGHPLVFAPAPDTMSELLARWLPLEFNAAEQSRVILPSTQRPDNSEFALIYSGCHLPELLRKFYVDLDKQRGVVERHDPSLRAPVST